MQILDAGAISVIISNIVVVICVLALCGSRRRLPLYFSPSLSQRYRAVMDELQARHRKEQKELQGKITSKKKNATKKTRKGVNDECDRLEQELREKQQAEIAALAPPLQDNETLDPTTTDDVDLDGLSITDSGDVSKSGPVAQHEGNAVSQTDSQVPQQGGGPKKPNRQKARLLRRAAEQEAEIERAAEEAANMPDQRQQEISAMKSQMEQHRLVETQIRPDGHCLYSACVQTIPGLERKTYRDVRIAAAEYMNAHTDDFAPFLEEPIDSYIHKVRDTAEWGGHLELQAIAKAYNINIHVLQANGHIEEIAPVEPSETNAWLAYYRHSFGLGEHYNALKQATP